MIHTVLGKENFKTKKISSVAIVMIYLFVIRIWRHETYFNFNVCKLLCRERNTLKVTKS